MNNQPLPPATLVSTQQHFFICEKPKSNYLQNKKSNQLKLVDPAKLCKAQKTIKQFLCPWNWKLCMHMAKQAYGVSCKAPLPELGDRTGNFICTYVNKEKGEYSFSEIHSEASHD